MVLVGRYSLPVLGFVFLLAWAAPVTTWAQGSLWGDLKTMAEQVVRDNIKSVSTAVTTPSPRPQPSEQTAQQPVAASSKVSISPPQQSAQAPIPEPVNASARSDLLSRIDKALSRARKPSDYCYEMTSWQGQVVGTWTEMTAVILGTKDLRVAYDNFYQTSVAYAGMLEVNLIRARRAALNNDPATATRLLEAALRYEKQFNLSDKAAIEACNGNLDASAELARGLYEGSKASVIYGSSFMMGPVGSRVVDTVFDATDFYVETSENGLSSATQKFVANKITEMIFSHAQLNGKTLEDTINQGVTKTLGNPEVYRVVREVVSKPGFAKEFMSFMAKSSAYIVGEITEDQINKIVTAITDEGAKKLPPLTGCGSALYQKVLLQLKEGTQAVFGGYSFDAACQAHDACYSNCGMSKSDCDNGLLTDALAICKGTWNKTTCISDARGFFLAVSKLGAEPFKQAHLNCPVSLSKNTNGGLLGDAMETPSGFNGTYYHDKLRFGFHITGNQGITTVSNSPNYKIGDVMLRFSLTDYRHFTGDQLCTDGVFHPVTGTLRDDGSIDMTIQGCWPASYTMVRSGNVASPGRSETTAPQPNPDVTEGRPADHDSPGLTGFEVAKALGSTTDYDRRDAIRRMVEHNSIRSPLSAREAALIVKGATGAARAQCIAALAKLIKHNLSGEEGATVLGSAREITEYDRRDAIRALAKEGKFGANGADAGLFLVGATGAARAQSIASFAKSLKPNLSGPEAATILGGSDVLKEYDRRDAIRALAESRRLRQGLLGDELAAMLDGTTGAARAQSIDALTKRQ